MFWKIISSLVILIQLFFLSPLKCYAFTVSDIIWSDKPKYLVQPDFQDGTAEWLLLWIAWKAIDLLLFFAWILSTTLIIVWWFRYVTYFWDDWAKKQAKSLILNSIIWLVIVICSALIVQNAERFISFLLG